jgi:beta-galactosidase
LRFRLPAGYAGKSIFLRFQGAATVADVFVNAHHAGSHRGAFGAFCFDVTDLVKPGQDNLLAVRVDNAKFDDVAPLSGDFTIWGGLYRGVELLVLDPAHISPRHDAWSGVQLVQLEVSDALARVQVKTHLTNKNAVVRDSELRYTVADADNRVVLRKHVSHDNVMGLGTVPKSFTLEIPRPRLWDGVRDPHLYRVTVELLYDGRVVDRVTQPLGLRYFHLDPDQGLILNGRPYRIRGVNRHQDRVDKGWAISNADHEEDFRLITEIGATGVRLAHYPHAEYVYDLCDRLGLVVWAELALVNDITKSAAFAANAKQQLREMIAQHGNHPSILFWSLYNELSMKEGTDFSAEQKLVSELNDLAHELDPTRVTVAATHKQNLNHPVNWIPQATAFNRYYGWYQGTPFDWAKELDDIKAKFPAKNIAISEYGAGASIYQHELNPVKPRTGGPWHPEEWQSICHEAAWLAMRDRPWLWGTFVWNMFDFAADERNEGDQPGRNDKGLVTYDRRTKKDAFYFYKASWRDDEPVVHITSKRFNPRPSGPSAVKVYSNCDSVELFLAGSSLGRTAADGTGIFAWPSVRLREGENHVRASGEMNGRTCVDEVTWSASRGATTRLTAKR